MMPRLGTKYANSIEVEVTSKPKAEFNTDEYFALDLPAAPAVMVGDEIVTEGKDVDDHTVESVICRHLGLPTPQKEGLMDRLFKRRITP